MKNNPITSIIGLIIAACPIVKFIKPQYGDLCDQLIDFFIGAGFIAAADGARKPHG